MSYCSDPLISDDMIATWYGILLTDPFYGNARIIKRLLKHELLQRGLKDRDFPCSGQFPQMPATDSEGTQDLQSRLMAFWVVAKGLKVQPPENEPNLPPSIDKVIPDVHWDISENEMRSFLRENHLPLPCGRFPLDGDRTDRLMSQYRKDKPPAQGFIDWMVETLSQWQHEANTHQPPNPEMIDDARLGRKRRESLTRFAILRGKEAHKNAVTKWKPFVDHANKIRSKNPKIGKEEAARRTKQWALDNSINFPGRTRTLSKRL